MGKWFSGRGPEKCWKCQGDIQHGQEQSENGTQGCSVWSIDGTLGDSTGTGDQPIGKGVLESGAGHAKETSSTVVTIGTNRKRLTGVFCLVNRVSLESTLQYGK